MKYLMFDNAGESFLESSVNRKLENSPRRGELIPVRGGRSRVAAS